MKNYHIIKNEKTLIETAHINKNENSIFPFDTWDIEICSNAFAPAHFHVIKDGWDVSCKIEDGSIIKVEKQGQEKDIYNYIVNHVADWLTRPCALLPKITNKENALLQWEQLHDNN